MRLIITSILVLTSLITYGQNPIFNDLWKLYQSQDYEKVIEEAKPHFDTDSLKVDLNLLLGRTYADKGDYEAAISYLDYTVKNDLNNSWRKAWALGYLGTCHFMLQDYENSSKSTKECFDLNATKNATRYAYSRILLFGFDDFYKDWKIVESENFRFHFQNMTDSDIERYISSREMGFKNINGFFESELPKKIDFFVWNSRDDAKKLLKANLGFADPTYCIVHSYYQQTIGHEMTHVISHYFDKIEMKTRFINEGTAVNFDMTNKNRMEMAKTVLEKNGYSVDVKAIWQNDGTEEEILYPIAGAFVEYLILHGSKPHFLELIKNQTLESAYVIYGDSLDIWINDFEKQFVHRQDISFQASNINHLDTTINKQIADGKLGENPLILLNGQEYTYRNYQKDKFKLNILAKDKIEKISILTGELANSLSIMYKNSTEDGMVLVSIGKPKKNK